MSNNEFDFISFILLAFSLALVLLTYNPSGYAWIGFLNFEVAGVYKAVTGIVLLIGWIMFLRATWNSLGPIGTILAAGFFGTFMWLFVEWGFFALDDTVFLQWAFLLVLSAVLAVGMSWSHVRRRISGQFDTDEIER